jgi:GNAT superfamily N-acetyltransferase
MNKECLELEALCPQGKEYRLSFVRDYFHKRAENFQDWLILVAKENDMVVGVTAVALKILEFKGRRMKGGVYFDLRVHPDNRRKGIAQKLGWASKEWALENRAEYHYLYCVNDNRAMKAIGTLVKGAEVGGYDLLIWPVYKRFKEKSKVEDPTGEEVHKECVIQNGPYDLYSDPYEDGWMQGYRRSFQIEGAGCSVWSNKGILEERVENLPLKFKLMGKMMRVFPLNRMKLPHLPPKGEILRGFYVYDLYSRGPSEARELMRHVNNWALAESYDYLYIIDPPGKGTIDHLRKDVPKLFSPKMRYCLLSHTLDKLETIYVDIRDL